MSYYLLPKTPFLIHKYIDYIETTTQPLPSISNSLSKYLYEIKQKIEEKGKDWDLFKKYTNPYEYVHTTIPTKKKCVSKDKHLSRSFFKMVEIVKTFKLILDNKPITTFHIAEGPGGFIEAVTNIRKNPKDNYIGITLIGENNDPNVPGWKKTDTFLKSNPNVYIEYGNDNTGNILSVENFIGCKEQYASSMDLITGDGGFDFSTDFNKQELSIANLLFAQICYAVTLQKKNGTFILKIFDSFMQHTVDILCILTSFYEKVYITKPNTSRYANSEKYIVCKNFLYNSCDNFFPFIFRAFEKMITQINNEDIYVSRFLSIPTYLNFIIKLEEYNAIFGQQQLENIHYTLSLIDNKHNQEKIDILIKNNIQKSIVWCTKHNLPYNVFLPTSVFSTPSIE